MGSAEHVWALCATELRRQVSDATWKTTFETVQPAWGADEELVLTVPSSLVRDRIESRYLPLLTDILAEVDGDKVLVRLEVRTDTAADHDAEPAGPEEGDWDAPVGTATPPSAVTPTPQTGPHDRPLDPRYTFDSFVVAESNRYAWNAARAVAETPGKPPDNPLLIYGDSGLGKTHLLHAIGHYVRQHFRGGRVLYVSTETFLNEFIEAIRRKTNDSFQRRYRQCDVLLVDDIQFMEHKERSKEEFFHTFNDLYAASKQMVITCDRHPSSLDLEDRLRSRLLMGLTTDIRPPVLETRVAILRNKAEALGANIPEEVLELIATHVKDNIRELEGALNRVRAHARHAPDQPLTRDVAAQILSDLLARDQPCPVTPDRILDATAALFGFTRDELCGPSRRRPLVTARQISMYVFRDLTEFSYPAIAREFGGRDHTTVIHAVDKITALMKERRQIYDQVTELTRRIRGGG